MRRRDAVLAGAIAAAALLGGLAALRPRPPEPPAARPGLDPGRWVRTSAGDFEEASVDETDGRLRLRAATRGTRDETVKFLGVRTLRSFPLEPGASVRARLDWNRQENGSYLSGALVLSPRATAGNPLVEDDWLKVEVVGVPPGRNARLQIVRRKGGRDRLLYSEGWPETNREGRPVATEELEVRIDGPGLTVVDEGRPVFSSSEALGFDTAYLYLQLSTHSNYPPRELFFDRIRLP